MAQLFKTTFLTLLSLSIGLVGISASPHCPIQGAEFPMPRNLADQPAWKAAMEKLSGTFDFVESTGQNYSFSVQVFSTNPGAPILFERFHTAQNLPKNTTGVKKVDADTVYRLGSVTKIFTVLTFLEEVGDKYFNHPITEFVPELAELNKRGDHKDQVREVDWDDITLLALMAQMSGIERDQLVLGEVIGPLDIPTAVNLGFPPLTPDEIPVCGNYPLCNRTQFFEGLGKAYPSFAPWKTPAYSNIAFQLLAYALESITGKSFEDMLESNVMSPLGLNRTYYNSADPAVGMIPRETADGTGWYIYLGDENPSGNMFASAGDLSTLGRAIMNSTLLKPSMTRRWLKPISFSSDQVAAVGAPWGLRRIHINDNHPHRTVTAFTKAGGVGDYSAFLSLLPDFGLGLTIMTAGQAPTGAIFGFADYIASTIIPAYDAASREAADALYGGTYSYKHLNPATNRTMNSSLHLNTEQDKPGLGVGTWFSNSSNMIPVALALQSGLTVASDPAAGANKTTAEASVRLYYTGLETKLPNGRIKQSFKAVFENVGGDPNPGKWYSTDCGVWIDYTGVTYAGQPLDEFIFELDDKTGTVVSVHNLALNATLEKIR
ncbi:beta-lactamase/transpeptidase-like protein [Apodospora peruviana]|uniref:Beta-lactamase/transpeptidase-like protein n=1 Tax=Apodospora peruviana TaxID=516989 RepID=A0AAE0MDQ0_9PEZI|nr:beta-lactamase/transpeptidase-like protein [Apodospora peruviana]